MGAPRASLTPEQVDAAINGERAAVEAFTQAYLPRVYGLCLRMCRRQELAEEATQETFVRALRALPRLRQRERITSWMLTIAANTTRELARKGQRNKSLEWEPAAIDVEVDDRLETRQKALDLALASLGQDERELFLLHTVEGVRLKTLADEHDVSVPAMKSRVHRIRSKVRVKALEHLEAVGAA
jgi:RNA polymerase sigma-70 factor (ECF subfamily)